MDEAKSTGRCVVVHLKTIKGKGYTPAENSPDGFHSVNKSKNSSSDFHSVFAKTLTNFAKTDDKSVAVTAAMGIGTGLDIFEKEHPERYFDVGIAEEHALTFSAGLAANGYKPFVAIYSTFLQRAYDNILHDICLQNLPVKIVIDRAGLALSDGATHHGIFDVAFLSHIPNIQILAPITYGSVLRSVEIAKEFNSPIAIRYPNSEENSEIVDIFYPDGDYTDFGVRTSFTPSDHVEYIFVTYGGVVKNVIEADKILKNEGLTSGIILLEWLKPYNDIAKRLINILKQAKRIVFVEEGIKNGGAGMLLADALAKLGMNLDNRYSICAIDDNFASPDKICDIYDYLNLSAAALAENMKKICGKTDFNT